MEEQTDVLELLESHLIEAPGEGVHSESTPPPNDLATSPAALPASVLSQKLLQHNEHGGLNEISAQDSGYNSSGSSVQQSPGDPLNGDMEEGELVYRRSRASSHTSISSIPASILTNLPDSMKPMTARESHDYMFQSWEDHSPGKLEAPLRTLQTIRQREATFRKPSSVRAMQMHTEDEGDDEYLTPPKRRGGQRISDVSIRSLGSSPLKRSPFYSPTGAAGKPKVKKEYPLVLLHCTLLPPSLPVPGLAAARDQKILKDVLPTVYWKRWKLLEEKIGSGVLRDRGVLISHPEDMYDLLEERLLESLELQRPRLDHGHFIGHNETESDREDRLTSDDSGTEDEGEKCLDCGARVVRHGTTRKWEIKVFAANGLMRAGAWAAAWKEMEKVDVEVGLWLPSDVRAELGRRMMENELSHIDSSLAVPLLQEPGNDSANPGERVAAPTLGGEHAVARVGEGRERSHSLSSPSVRTKSPEDPYSTPHHKRSSEDIDLHTLLINYIRVLASDRRNVAIAFLSVLMVFTVLNSKSGASTSDLRPFPPDILEYTPSITVPLEQHSSQSSIDSISLETQPVTVSDVLDSIASTPTPEVLEALIEFPSFSVPEPSALEVMVEPSHTASETFATESTHVISEEQEQPTHSSETTSSDAESTTSPARTAQDIFNNNDGAQSADLDE